MAASKKNATPPPPSEPEDLDILPDDDEETSTAERVALLEQRLDAAQRNRIDPAELDAKVKAQAERLFSEHKAAMDAERAAERVALLEQRLDAAQRNRIDPAELDAKVKAQAERLFSEHKAAMDAERAAEREAFEAQARALQAEREALGRETAQARADIIRTVGAAGGDAPSIIGTLDRSGPRIPHGTKGQRKVRWAPEGHKLTATVSSKNNKTGHERQANGYPLVLRWPGGRVVLRSNEVKVVDAEALDYLRKHNPAIKHYMDCGALLDLGLV